MILPCACLPVVFGVHSGPAHRDHNVNIAITPLAWNPRGSKNVLLLRSRPVRAAVPFQSPLLRLFL
jgi:hypothetical protein